MSHAYLALALTGPHLLELLASPALLARWDELPLAFTVLGIDRIDGSAPATLTLDSSAVGAALSERTRHGRFLITASPQRDHPYNLARRVASLGHHSGGRSGVLFGAADAYAPVAPQGQGPWSTAGTTVGASPVTAALDAARAVRVLEQSWPHASIIGDRETGILTRSDEIVHVDLDGTFAIAGPLNVPEPPTGPSVIAWLDGAGDPAVTAVDSSAIDLTIGQRGDIALLSPGEPVDPESVGHVLRAPADLGVAALFDHAEQLFRAGTHRPEPVGGPLRTALDLPAPPRPPSGRPAFPVPQPHPARGPFRVPSTQEKP